MLSAAFRGAHTGCRAHQTWIARTDGRRGWQDHLKMAALRLVITSRSARRWLHLAGKILIIGNPFEPGDSETWERIPHKGHCLYGPVLSLTKDAIWRFAAGGTEDEGSSHRFLSLARPGGAGIEAARGGAWVTAK